MTELHSTRTWLEAWAKATSSIISEDFKQDVILDINSPEIQHDKTQEVLDKLDNHYTSVGMEPIHTVAEWIFPGWLYQKEGIEGVFEKYPEQLETIMENSPGYNWGTYFGRMVEQKNPDTGDVFNPLKILIEKMSQANQPEGTTFHSCYELSLQGESGDISTYNPSSDQNLRRNLPCLTHLSFKLYDDEVHLTALYRSHDYRFKVPGNLLGLARLQTCVANEIGAEMGQLVVHSSRASIQQNEPKIGEFKDIVNRVMRDINNESLDKFGSK